jgi:hypothetical protein
MKIKTYIFILFISLSASVLAQNFIITKSFTGSWFDPNKSGQGFLIEIINTNGQKQALATWYTYDTAGNQLWLIGVGAIQQQQITFEMRLTEGGAFGNAHDPNNISSTVWGDVTLAFTNCNTATASWSPVLPGFGAGSMPLTRLTQINNLNCTGGLFDELGDTANVDELRIILNSTGLAAGASGKAKYRQRSDRIDFSVEAEDVPVGTYDLLIGGDNKGSINVVDNAGIIQGEIEFRDPVEPGKILLDFDPRGQLIEVAQGGQVFLTSTLPDSGNNGNDGSANAPPFGSSRVTRFFDNPGVFPAAKAKAKLRQRSDRVDFSVEIEDTPVGFYDLMVAGSVVGIIEVVQTTGTEGEIEFRNPVEPGKELLDFNPIGQLLEIVQDGQVIFTMTFDIDDGGSNGGGNTPPANTPLRLDVDMTNLGVDADADGKIDYRVRTDRKRLNVEIEDLDDDTYQLFIGQVLITDIVVTAGKGEVEFRDPVEAGKLPLDFDPLGQLFEIKKGNTVYLSAVLE